MNTYRPGTGTFFSKGKYCVLGVYLKEKHEWIEGPAHSPQNEAGWLLVRDAVDDISIMTQVLMEHGWEDRSGCETVWDANDSGAPIDQLQEALRAVGVHVNLIDGRRKRDV